MSSWSLRRSRRALSSAAFIFFIWCVELRASIVGPRAQPFMVFARMAVGRPVGSIELPVIVATAGQRTQFFVAHVLDHGPQARVGAEEMLPYVSPVLGGQLLELAVHRAVHLVQQHPVGVTGQ